MVPHLCFNVVSIGGVLSRQASLPIQRHHILSRALSSHSSHHTSHTDDSYTLYSSTRPVLTHHNGLDQHSGSVRIRLLGINSRIHACKPIILPQEPIQEQERPPSLTMRTIYKLHFNLNFPDSCDSQSKAYFDRHWALNAITPQAVGQSQVIVELVSAHFLWCVLHRCLSALVGSHWWTFGCLSMLNLCQAVSEMVTLIGFLV